jgi:hypothetical protein
MMVLLILVLGKDGIWVAITGKQLVGLVLLFCWCCLSAEEQAIKRIACCFCLLFFTGTVLLEFEIMNFNSASTAEPERLGEPLREPLKGLLSDSGMEEKVIKRQKLNEACFVSILSIRAGRYVTQYAKHF